MKLIKPRKGLRKTSYRSHKKPRICQDGPWKGYTLWLTDSKTLPIQLPTCKGYYNNGYWVNL
jgi:hypothetical protein